MTTAAAPREELQATYRRLADQVHEYARSVVSGETVAGRPVRQACERHLRDLEAGQERGLRFDAEKAGKAIHFFSFLELSEGEHAGKPFQLQPWQIFIVGSLFGWLGGDGYRRFRDAYIEIGKGNGKTPLGAGLLLLLLAADGEPGAECYCAAVTREQASIGFRDTKLLAESSPALARRLTIMERNIAYPATNSFLRPVSSEHRGLDGKRVHGALIDELHEHPTSLVVDKMRAGTKGRRQALVLRITNSGYDRKSVCFQEHTYSRQILDGALENDAWFAYVCQLDVCEAHRLEGKMSPVEGCADCDDWTDESCWPKANPNLGVSITSKYLREQVASALGMPSKQGIVMRLNFCIWTQQLTKWLSIDAWMRGSVAVDRATLRGRSCYGGLDLAPVHDLSSLTLLFPPLVAGEKWKALLFNWCPEADIPERVQRDRVPYDLWSRPSRVQTGPGKVEELPPFITVTDGNTTDFDFIEAAIGGVHENGTDIEGLAEEFRIQEIAYDRAFAHQVVQHLQDKHGLTMVPFGQGFFSMAAPTAELERLVKANEIEHGVHPIYDWAASNVVVRRDPAGNMKPDKEASPERIDPIVSLVMALGRAMVHQAPPPSVYEKRGARWL